MAFTGIVVVDIDGKSSDDAGAIDGDPAKSADGAATDNDVQDETQAALAA